MRAVQHLPRQLRVRDEHTPCAQHRSPISRPALQGRADQSGASLLVWLERSCALVMRQCRTMLAQRSKVNSCSLACITVAVPASGRPPAAQGQRKSAREARSQAPRVCALSHSSGNALDAATAAGAVRGEGAHVEPEQPDAEDRAKDVLALRQTARALGPSVSCSRDPSIADGNRKQPF